MSQTAPRETRLADYRPPAYLVDTVDLAFDLDEAATKVRRVCRCGAIRRASRTGALRWTAKR